MISLTTGPSRTADIEKTLVVGVHGPKEVYVFLVDAQWRPNTSE
jgi:L-lactate dehydrogenase complex protein LldG